jgi:hypothetical protein
MLSDFAHNPEDPMMRVPAESPPMKFSPAQSKFFTFRFCFENIPG